jgi:hypothetical protein
MWASALVAEQARAGCDWARGWILPSRGPHSFPSGAASRPRNRRRWCVCLSPVSRDATCRCSQRPRRRARRTRWSRRSRSTRSAAPARPSSCTVAPHRGRANARRSLPPGPRSPALLAAGGRGRVHVSFCDNRPREASRVGCRVLGCIAGIDDVRRFGNVGVRNRKGRPMYCCREVSSSWCAVLYRREGGQRSVREAHRRAWSEFGCVGEVEIQICGSRAPACF